MEKIHGNLGMSLCMDLPEACPNSSLGFGVWAEVEGLGFRVDALVLKVWRLGFKV